MNLLNNRFAKITTAFYISQYMAIVLNLNDKEKLKLRKKLFKMSKKKLAIIVDEFYKD